MIILKLAGLTQPFEHLDKEGQKKAADTVIKEQGELLAEVVTSSQVTQISLDTVLQKYPNQNLTDTQKFYLDMILGRFHSSVSRVKNLSLRHLPQAIKEQNPEMSAKREDQVKQVVEDIESIFDQMGLKYPGGIVKSYIGEDLHQRRIVDILRSRVDTSSYWEKVAEVEKFR